MAHINFVNGSENTSHFNEYALFLIATFITDDAEALGAEGIPDNLYITSCDIDRIYLSTNPKASPDSPPDYVIRMWDYHICEDNPEMIHMNCTYHIMGDCPDGSGRCSDEQFDGDYDILVYGEIAELRAAVLKGLTAIQIPGSVTVIPQSAFKGCSNLKEVHIPDGVTVIESLAFSGCKSLSKINFPDSLTTIGAWAFWGCFSLQEIHIPDNVIEIGSDAFRHCDSLTEISIPILNISEIGLREETHISLRANEGIRQIPDGITCIPPETFKNCSEIKSVRIPNSVTIIGWGAFRGCSGLQEVIIPDNVMGIGKDAFMDCNNLTEISVPLGLSIASAGLEDSTRVVIRNNDGIRVIPEGVTEIIDSAFEDCTELKRIQIPDSVTSIGENAFKGCSALSEIHIPANVTSIAENAFGDDKWRVFWRLSRISVSSENRIYDSRDNCNAIIETATGRIITECKNTVLSDSWFKSICEAYGFTGSDDPDEEIRTLTIIKNSFETINTETNDDSDVMLGESIKLYVSKKFRREWYKNYIGTKKITFDGPTDYEETGEITDEDISAFINDSYMVEFANYRLKVGHTERQERITEFLRYYPLDVLAWLEEDDYQTVIPYGFYCRLARGGDYELFGYSKERFLTECGGIDSEMQFEYAAILEEKYGIDYAVDYIIELRWDSWLYELTDGTNDFIRNLLKRAVDNNENEKALELLAFSYIIDWEHRDLSMSIELMSRLATLWKKGLISDDWITDDSYGLAGIIDFDWGDDCWEEDDYPDCPEEDEYRIWLLMLLESDFAEDISDYLKPLLEMVLQKEKNHNWETGKKAIEVFLSKTSNK